MFYKRQTAPAATGESREEQRSSNWKEEEAESPSWGVSPQSERQALQTQTGQQTFSKVCTVPQSGNL